MSAEKHLTPVWIVYADGKRLDVEHEGALRKIAVNDRLNGISTFSLVFDTSAVKIRDKGVISLESQISIHLGYKDDVGEVFKGEVLGFRAILPEYGAEQLEVTGSNVLHKLNHARHSISFEQKKPSDIIKGIIESYSLKAEVEDFGSARIFTSEQGYSDYEYILKLAESYGKDIYAYDSTIYAGSEIKVRTDEIIFEWGKSLISFEAEENIKTALSGVTYIGWDSMKNEAFSGNAVIDNIPLIIGGSVNWTGISKGGNGKWEETITDQEIIDADDARQQAEGALQKNSYNFSKARGIAEGNYKLIPGMRVMIKMAGESFSGEYIAESVTHQFDYKGGYKTEFSLKRNALP